MPAGETIRTSELDKPSEKARNPLLVRHWIASRFIGLTQVGFSFADQALAVGGTFLANVALARTQSKEEYGTFALSYSVFTFLAALHNSAILEPCTIYASGRYRNRFSQYLRLMVKMNAGVGLTLMALVLLSCLLLSWMAPSLVSRSLLGMGVTVGVLLSGAFLRRVFYLQRQPVYAAEASLICCVVVAIGLWVTTKTHVLNGFSVFLVLASGWLLAGICLHGRLTLANRDVPFLNSEPGYWREHWMYSRWVLATAFVFQLTTQGYYWVVAAFLSVKEVAELRAMYLLLAPVDQVFIALTFVVVPALSTLHASHRMPDFVSLLWKYALGVFAAAMLFVLGAAIVGKPIIHLLYAGKFDGLVPLFYLLSFLPLFMGLSSVMSGGLNALEKPRLVFYGYSCSGMATFLIGIPLVIHFGLRGAVYGLLLSGAVFTTAVVIGFCSSLWTQRNASNHVINREPGACMISPAAQEVQ